MGISVGTELKQAIVLTFQHFIGHLLLIIFKSRRLLDIDKNILLKFICVYYALINKAVIVIARIECNSHYVVLNLFKSKILLHWTTGRVVNRGRYFTNSLVQAELFIVDNYYSRTFDTNAWCLMLKSWFLSCNRSVNIHIEYQITKTRRKTHGCRKSS